MADAPQPPAPSGLSELSEAERSLALARFQILQPFLEDQLSLPKVARAAGISLRAARYWVQRYHQAGLAGLARKSRDDKNQRKLSTALQEFIEGLALQKPRLSTATIHRQAVQAAQKLGESPPCYSVVHRVIRNLQPGLVTLAHEGSKAYSDSFDLVYRREAEAPNAIWQADHSELDIWILREDGTPKKPWLTIVFDDYSRAVAGFYLFFGAPSAIQTALALRQAIWRKPQAAWHICGIPQVLYTDHGSDFTSQHLEQVAADLKMQLICSGVARPRGRGKIERFFETLTQVFLPRFPGFCPKGSGVREAKLALPDLARELEAFLLTEYHLTPHSTTQEPPQARWEAGGFLPQMPQSLEQLDLLLLTVPKTRKVHPDGIKFMGLRYIDPTLAAYVGEEVLLRYDPRDMAEIRVFYQDRFLCRAICQELAGETVSLREIIRARNQRRRELRQTLEERRRTVDALLEAKRWDASAVKPADPSPQPAPQPVKLKRYFHDRDDVH
jgi:putative transposase